MKIFKNFSILIIVYLTIVMIGGSFQKNLIFFPGKLSKDFKYELTERDEEIFLKTDDGEEINALFYRGGKAEIVLYFHGNAGDLSNWQFIAEDFVSIGYNFLIIDYREYGKSSGEITEAGLYEDAEAAYRWIISKGFLQQDIIIYGRSIGTGVAADLASKHAIKGLILESPYMSLKKLANQKAPYLLPSLFLQFHFNNIDKINSVKSPILFFHGAKDSLIPVSHTNELYEKFEGKKSRVIIQEGTHNDLNSFSEYHDALARTLPDLFS